MKGSYRLKFLSILLILAYLLSACSGAAPQSTDQTTVGSGKPQAMEVSFTGSVESLSAGAITISGQTVTLDAKSVVDPNVKVGDIVKVEAQVSETGTVLALKVEAFGADDTNTNAGNTKDDTNANSNTNDNSNASNDNSNVNTNGNDNTNTAGGSIEKEVSGVVSAITADSITVDGVVYKFAASTEFKDAIFAGDTVKLHVTVNGDGTFTVREIEKTAGTSLGNDNSNSDDDNGNDDNSNGGEDDDHEDDNSNGNGNGNGG